MNTPTDDLRGRTDDVELLDLMRRGFHRLEPEPAHLKELAYGARFMDKLEAELAELIFDSFTAPGPAVRRGGESEARLLSFSNDHLTLDVSLAADKRTILGEIDPAIATELVLEPRDGSPVEVTIDEFGRFFVLSDAPSFRIRVTGHLVTPWIDRL
jgi:hypothetical protein